jgi:DNA-binding NarL/FixJ family response regulator
MQTPPFQVLVVDDFAPWRRVVHTMLQHKPELQIVCEASDGLDAVQKARELQPDLILLDIGLPTLNGVEAARRIRILAPRSKILFVSENYSADIAREALRIGGSGYVIKSDAGSELLDAVDAVLQGRQFVSARLADQFSARITNAPQDLNHSRIKEILASFAGRLPRNQGTTRRHEVQFYSDASSLGNGLSRFVGAALGAGDVVVACATEPHRNSFVEGLQAHGLDVRSAMQRGNYAVLDVDATISGFIVNDLVDPVRYLQGMSDLVESALRAARSDHPRVAVCGELALPLLVQGNAEAVIQIERLSDEFANEYEIDILCLYPAESPRQQEFGQIFQRICAEHSTVYS